MYANKQSIKYSAEATAHFKQCNAACMRSIANNPTMQTELADHHCAKALGMSATIASSYLKDQPITLLRGIGDALALVTAHHDGKLHQRLKPLDRREEQLFNAMEQVRCESLGATSYAGVAQNLDHLHASTHSADIIRTASGLRQLTLIVACITRESLTSEPSPIGVRALLVLWRDNINNLTGNRFQQLAQLASSQQPYAKLSLEIIRLINVQSIVSDGEPEHPTVDQLLSDDSEQDDAAVLNVDADTLPKDDELAMEEAAATIMREELEEQRDTVMSAADAADQSASIMPNRDAPVSADAGEEGHGLLYAGGSYQVYSTQYDEIVSARELADDAQLGELRLRLDEQIQRYSSLIGRLSGRLQRVLMAQQQRHWQFDLDEGYLDTSRLTRVVTQPLSALSFKAESEQKFRDTTITLLVDNSKSMLGKPITIAAACTDILARTLERCGVSVEILGFTTTELQGSQAMQTWIDQGAPENPGRLNGLRHIVYKSADVPYRNARKGIGLMLRGDLLKQNIDGEALLWAQQRIRRRPEQRKVIMMISDGAPIDTSTMAQNAENYLVEHLHQVIAQIESQKEIELVAIGIGHDVSAYYQKSITIYDVKKLGRAMLTQLSHLFKSAANI